MVLLIIFLISFYLQWETRHRLEHNSSTHLAKWPFSRYILLKLGIIEWWCYMPLALVLGRHRQAGLWVPGQPELRNETLSATPTLSPPSKERYWMWIIAVEVDVFVLNMLQVFHGSFIPSSRWPYEHSREFIHSLQTQESNLLKITWYLAELEFEPNYYCCGDFYYCCLFV